MRVYGIVFIMLIMGGLAPGVHAESPAEVLVADFDSGEPVTNLGAPVEIWLKGNGSDETQTCKLSFVEDDALDKEYGQALRLDYDVDSPNPAYNGMRFSLEGVDATGMKTLNFYVRGDAEAGFGKKMKIEVIGSSGRPSPYIFDGITDTWQKVSIPLSEFFVVQDWSSLHQFVVVFADITNDPKSGTIYLDEVSFS